MTSALYPKISIITPSLNQGQYIEQTIQSIINQSYPNLEYIIIDGGSTDNTVDIIKKYENHITYWVSEKDNGQSDAINKGIQQSTGEIFNWINSDDYLEPGALFKIAEYFTTNSDIKVVSGWCRLFDNDTNEEILTHRSEIFETLEETLIEQKINQQSTFIKLKYIKEFGGVKNSLNYVMDLELWFRYLFKFGQSEILLVNELFSHFRIHSDAKTQLQHKFRNEERTLWFSILSQLGANKAIVNYYNSNDKYCEESWENNFVDKNKLTFIICKKYLFRFYGEKEYTAGRYAFSNLLRQFQIPIKWNYFSLFFKLFICDIKFRDIPKALSKCQK
jgi:glycosyltransferase involved in cell wall biosynthesis